ncbi:hypothetical protein [Streptomyces sp. NPDC017964]
MDIECAAGNPPTSSRTCRALGYSGVEKANATVLLGDLIIL